MVPIPRKRNVDNWQIICAKRARNSMARNIIRYFNLINKVKRI